MVSPSLGAALVGPDALPCVGLSRLLAALAAPPFDWLSIDGEGLTIDVARALEARACPMPVHRVERHEVAVLGGALDEADLAASGKAARELRRAVEARLEALGVGPVGREGDSPRKHPRVVRFTEARFEQLGEPRLHNALVVLGAREEFPEREAVCQALGQAMLEVLGQEAFDRFREHLPLTEVPPLRPSTPRRQMEAFVRFLQEQGMARVRVHVALEYLEALARGVPGDEGRLAVRYAIALRAIVEAAGKGTELDESVSLGRLGELRPLSWASTDFVGKLPLVPRADCEIAESDDEERGRRGIEARDVAVQRVDQRTRVRVRHVAWLPRFNASGPERVDGGKLDTTLGSRASMLCRELRDGLFDDKRELTEARRQKVLRAVEQHLVVRAAVQAASQTETSPAIFAVEQVKTMLRYLASDRHREGAVRRFAQGYREGERHGAVEPLLEQISQALAHHAGKSPLRRKKRTFLLEIDDEVFADRAASPLVASRKQGDPGAGPPWAWLSRLRVCDGESVPRTKLSLRVEIALAPRALVWGSGRPRREVSRVDSGPLEVVLHLPQKGEGQAALRSLLDHTLSLPRSRVTLVVPRLAGGDRPYRPEEGGLEARQRERCVAATVIARAALEAALKKLDPRPSRPARLLSVFDQGRERDLADDAWLRALGKALEGSLPGRPVLSQGVVLAAGAADPQRQRRHQGAQRALRRGDGVSFPAHHAREQDKGQAEPVGVVVLAGRPVDAVSERSGQPVVEEEGRDLLWGKVYLARFDQGEVTVLDRGTVGAIYRVQDEWPEAVVRVLGELKGEGCSHVALLTHRAFERRTWRGEARNRLYDGELPVELLAKQPACEGLAIVPMLCDTITAIAADPDDGDRLSDGRLLVARGEGLYPEQSFPRVRPLLAVATNRTLGLALAPQPDGKRRTGLRRGIHVYLERRGEDGPSGLPPEAEGRLCDALLGLHMLESESDDGSSQGGPPLLTPTLHPHGIFDVVRRVDASELLFHDGHTRTWVSLLGFAVTVRSLSQGAAG